MVKSLIVVIVGLFFWTAQCQSPADDVRITNSCTDKLNEPAPCLVVGNDNVVKDGVLVFKTFVKIPIPFITRSTDLVLPEGGSSSNMVITYLEVRNEGFGGKVTMTKGGPGHKTVSLHLESPRNSGYAFSVFIKGIDINNLSTVTYIISMTTPPTS